MTLHLSRVGDRSTASAVRSDLSLYGPGDVVGIESEQVLRTEPMPSSTDGEPTFFPCVEFAAPELPWAFTPAAADERGRLRPWLCLVVVPAETTIVPAEAGLPAWMSVAADELPDLSESWAWAHVQVTVDDGEDVAEVLRRRPERALSRLVCPRRLRPETAYRACVVPTFEAGRRAGLGEKLDDQDELRPAWMTSDQTVRLPVYHHWSFSTGKAGDFESLASELRYRPSPQGVGTRDVDVTSLAEELGVDPPTGGTLPFAGALRPPRPDDEPDDGSSPLREALARALDITQDPGDPGDERPIRVSPPVYGDWQASSAGTDHSAPWLLQLNTDPRHRAAAAYGALIVKDRQHELVAAAWTQAGQIEEANELLRRSQLAREVGGGMRRRLARLTPEEVVAIAGPTLTRVRLSQQTAAERIRHSALPSAAASATFRRLVRPRGPLARQAGLIPSDGDNPNLAGGGSLLARLADGTLRGAPEPRVPRAIDTAPPVDPDEPVEEPDESLEEALVIDRRRLHRPSRVTEPEPPEPLQLDTVRDTLLDRLDPDRTVARRGVTRVTGGLPADDPLGEATITPTISEPLYRALSELSEEAFLPGLDRIPTDTVTLLQANAEFVEAVLVGANHEFSRELLWRGFPTDQRATYFRSFWASREDAPGRKQRIDQWDSHLGDNHSDANNHDQLALLIRGELLRRYPGATVYAARAEHPPGGGPPEPSDTELYPHLKGDLEPDAAYLAFDLTIDTARSRPGDPGWFFVLQEPPAGARFGMDPAPDDEPAAGAPDSWATLSWAHLAETAGDLAALRYVGLSGPLDGVSRDGAEWAFNAAHMAQITLERPLRLAIHADDLLPRPEDDD